MDVGSSSVDGFQVFVTAGAAAVTAFIGAATAPLVRIRHERRQELTRERLEWVTGSRARIEDYFFPDPDQQYSLRDFLDDDYLVLEPPASLLNIDPHARFFWSWANSRVREWFDTEHFGTETHRHRPAERIVLRPKEIERARAVMESWGRAELLTGPVALRVRAVPFRARFAALRRHHRRIMSRPAEW